MPEMALETVIVSERLNTSAASFVTLPVPSVPVLPPSPTCSVPAEMFVPPE